MHSTCRSRSSSRYARVILRLSWELTISDGTTASQSPARRKYNSNRTRTGRTPASSFMTEAETARAILAHLGEPTALPRVAPPGSVAVECRPFRR
jgi:hypothetical protein